MEKEQVKITEINKLKKKINTAATSMFALGVLGIVVSVGFYTITLFYSFDIESSFFLLDTTGLVFNTTMFSLWIVLAKRIKSLKYIQTGRYILSGIVISSILTILSLLSGGGIGILLILLIVYLVSAEIAFYKLIKENEFKESLMKDNLFNTKNILIIVLTFIILSFISIIIDGSIFYSENISGQTEENLVINN